MSGIKFLNGLPLMTYR